jgi:acyl-coenzyme A synthetase/AMP-(fatty) acid ligase
MQQSQLRLEATLGDWLRRNTCDDDWTFWGARASASLRELITGSTLGGHLPQLTGRSILIATDDQIAAALALIELDGVARRLVLCPPGLAPEHLPAIVRTAEVDALVTDRAADERDTLGIDLRVLCDRSIRPGQAERPPIRHTEWVLLTSGTLGTPKGVVHNLASLTAAIKPGSTSASPIVWATFYDIRRYGGLQIFLRAILGGASLVLSDSKEPVGQFLSRLREHGTTHITGTPSHWRRALWSPSASSISPQYARMSGEVADQAIIDSLRSAYPQAKIGHAYASTEAGVGFHVDDEREGFPASFVGAQRDGVEIRIENGSLHVRSPGTASRYLGEGFRTIPRDDGFVDTGDTIEVRNQRCYFVGRAGGIINVGGMKVHPEEVEGVINRHPDVRMSLVRPKKNPITGSVVVADVVLNALDTSDADTRKSEVKSEIIKLCRNSLTEWKVPVAVSFVQSLAMTEGGKLARAHA